MNLLDAVRITAKGLSAERVRLNVAAMNLANAHVTRTLDGGPYRAKNVIFKAVPYVPEGRGTGQPSEFEQALARSLETVEVAGIVDDPAPFKEVYDPGHPDADSRGMVRLPNVNVMEEMVEIMTASRAYEAGVTVLGTAKAMALKALEIAR